MKNNLTFPRFTVVVASKEENTATGRNSIKRILREVFRYNLAKMPVDLVVFGKKGLKNKDFSEINSNVKRALEDLNL